MSEASKILKRIREGDDDDHWDKLATTGFWGAQAAGCLVFAKTTKRFLVALRSNAVHPPNCWGTIGGAIDKGEDPAAAVQRELKEETGLGAPVLQTIPLYVFHDPKGSGFKYFNFLLVVEDEFEARTNWETARFAWVTLAELQALSPAHPGLTALLQHSHSELQEVSI